MLKRKKKIICRLEKCLLCIIIALTLKGKLSTFVENWQPFHSNRFGPVWGWNVPLFLCFHVLSTGAGERQNVTWIPLRSLTLSLESPTSATGSLWDRRAAPQGAPHCPISCSWLRKVNHDGARLCPQYWKVGAEGSEVQGPLQLCEECGTSLGYIRPCIKNQITRQGKTE